VGINKLSASDDGKTLTTDWRTIFDNGKESGGKFDSEREGGAPAAANKVSGEWRPVRTNASEDVITTTYKATAAGFAMSDPTRGFLRRKVRRQGILLQGRSWSHQRFCEENR
jgi:hypothetical protein